MKRLTPAIFLIVLSVLLLWRAWDGRRSGSRGPDTLVLEGPTMGTTFRVQLVVDELPEDQEALGDAIRDELEGVNQRMSTYLEDSELSRFNRHSETTPFAVSEDTFEVLSAAREISDQTGGALDVTLDPLIDAWGFGSGAEMPSIEPERVAELLEQIGFDQLELDRAQRSIRKLRGDLSANLSAIAKGYAIDRVAERLTSLGFPNHWVEVGGEVRAAGTNAAGIPWRVGIERPEDSFGTVQRVVPLANLAIATSGDYRNYREVDGERFSHIMDPRTGWPIRHRLASVSVLHPQCMIADGLATALMVMGSEDGYELALREDLPALFLIRSEAGFEELGTPRFWELTGNQPESTPR